MDLVSALFLDPFILMDAVIGFFLNSIENDIFLFVFSRRGLPILVAFDTGKNKTSKIGF